MVVCHFGLLNRHFASISGQCFQKNLKLDVFHVLQPFQFIMFFSFLTPGQGFLSYYLCRGQKFVSTCLNDRIKSTSLFEFSYLNKWSNTYVHTYL